MPEDARDLTAVLGYAVLATAAVWLFSPGGLAGLLVAPLLLFCPGYALVRAIEGPRHVDGLELAITTVALSFATAALGGLLLNSLDVHLAAREWSAMMLGVTAAAVAIAVFRAPRPALSTPPVMIHVRAMPLLVVGATCLLLVAAVAVADRSQRALDRRTSVTTLGVARAADGSALRIVVDNAESSAGRYRIRTAAGGRITSFSLTLQPGASWSGIKRLPAAAGGPVRVQLLSTARPAAVLRTVTLK